MLVAVVLLVAGILFWQNRRPGEPSAGESLAANTQSPQFSVVALDGQPIDSAKLRGKVVLAYFWATWCIPCQTEIPHFSAWQKKYENKGLQVVGFSMDDTVAPVEAFSREHKFDYPIALADEKTIAAFGGVLGLPANVLLGRDGRRIAKHVGVTDVDSLEQEVQRALAQ